MDIYSLLKKEHSSVKDMVRQMIKSGEPDREMFGEFRRELKVHMEGEEQFLYPELVKNGLTRMMSFRSYAEHDAGKFLMERINSENDPERWIAELEVLDEILQEHMKEEEKHVFDSAKTVLGLTLEDEIFNKYTQLRADMKVHV